MKLKYFRISLRTSPEYSVLFNYLKMSARPKRLVSRPNYRQLANFKVPKTINKTHRRDKNGSLLDSTLYRLKILEEDEVKRRVKVRYIGYSDEYDEWRRIDEIVSIEDENDSDLAPSEPSPTASMKFCLFDELACRIKSLLFSSRKASPICSIVLSFDPLHFDSLVIRGTKKETKGTKEIYSLSCLTKLDDLLGDRWYIRGINSVGDFCYVEPDSVRFYLKFLKLKPDFQMKEDGTLAKHCFGVKSQLVFQFIRSDGTSQQWGSVLRSCRR